MASKLSADDAESLRLARQLQEDDDRRLAQQLQNSYQAGIFSPERVTIPSDDDEPVLRRPANLYHNVPPLHHMSSNQISRDMSPETEELIMAAFNTAGVWEESEDEEEGVIVLDNAGDEEEEGVEELNRVSHDYTPQRVNLLSTESEFSPEEPDSWRTPPVTRGGEEWRTPPVVRHTPQEWRTPPTTRSDMTTPPITVRGAAPRVPTRVLSRTNTADQAISSQQESVRVTRSRDEEGRGGRATRGRIESEEDRAAERREVDAAPQERVRGRREIEALARLTAQASSSRGGRRGRQRSERRRNHSGRRNETAHRTIFQGTPLMPDPDVEGTHILQPPYLQHLDFNIPGNFRVPFDTGLGFHAPGVHAPSFRLGFLDQSLTYEEMTALDEDNLAPGRGLDKRGIEQNSLKKKFETGKDTCGSCNICLTDFEDGEDLRTLPCFHSFHCDCIDNWLSRSPICPVCRTVINEQPSDPSTTS